MQSLNTPKSKREFNEMKAGRDALLGFENAHELVAFLRDEEADPALRNEPFRALVAAAQCPEAFAGLARSLLLLSVMASLEATAGRTHRRMCAEEVMAEVVAEFYDGIRRLDLFRVKKVAATLSMNTKRNVEYVGAKARKVQAVIQQLEQAKGEMPTNDEIAAAMRITLSDYERLIDEIKPVSFVCLDSVQDSETGSETSRYESIPDEGQPDPVETASNRELSAVIAERLEQLPEIQRKVLALYYFEDMRLREIAEVFNVTESRICQIHAQAILAIKSYLQRHENLGA